jgi:hypothetical protein
MPRKNQPGCPCGCGTTTVCITACGPIPVYGAVITVYAADGSVLGTCTTGPTGCCTIASSIKGTHLVTVTIGGVVVFLGKRYFGGGTIAIPLGAGAGLVCCGGYAIPEVLTLTDADGALSFVYDPNYVFPLWTGGHAVQRQSASVTTPNNICVVAPPSDGPVRICYQMICHAGQVPTFAVQRSWSWVYRQGTLVPIYYQDNSGFAPGQFCITAPPAICGNPLTDTASFGADPSSTTPFMLSGTPISALSNATQDPVGGTVAISG